MRWWWLVVLAACGDNGHSSIDAAITDTDTDAADAGPDATPDAEVFGPWSVPTMTSLPQDSDDPTMTADGLELYFNYSGDIYLTTRTSADAAWGMPSKVLELSATAFDTTPEVLPNGLTIYFASRRTPTVGQEDIWMSTRADRQSVWGTPIHVPELSTANFDSAPTTLDNLTMVLCIYSGSATEVYISTRASTSDAWPTPVEVTELSTGIGECNPMLSADQRTIYYDSASSGGGDLMIATRASTSDPFSNAQTIDNVDSAIAFDADPWVSLDGHHMFLESNQGGTYGIFESSR